MFSAHELISSKSRATICDIFRRLRFRLPIPKSALRISTSSVMSASIFLVLVRMVLHSLAGLSLPDSLSAASSIRVSGVFSSWEAFMKNCIFA